MGDQAVALGLRQQFISAEHILFLAAYFVRRGVSKIRLTGGEPLMRKDLPEIIGMFAYGDNC
ncbi:hypothetical protein X801_09314 [Opisthorchis viverrini]|uniref:Radical SAM core domain-containing protein n=1 Tax=Opisthorchis viverrini TaxID=6198 RepID=A0A1S8WKC4_OPIVI|nr:hypothetical protein X801_09314 [Opisthorchis viverrini]